MNVIVGILWLLAGVGLFGYEWWKGEMPYRIRAFDISFGWLFLLLALYNFARWFSQWSKPDDRASQYIREARLRQAQRRERPEPDPTFDFTNQPPTSPPTIRPPLDQPPSNN